MDRAREKVEEEILEPGRRVDWKQGPSWGASAGSGGPPAVKATHVSLGQGCGNKEGDVPFLTPTMESRFQMQQEIGLDSGEASLLSKGCHMPDKL